MPGKSLSTSERQTVQDNDSKPITGRWSVPAGANSATTCEVI